MQFFHIPVLYNETIDGLDVKPNGTYIDATLGGGGHAEGIVKKLKSGMLYANDLDLDAITASKNRLDKYLNNITFVHGDYKNLLHTLKGQNASEFDGILIDLGVSSYQLDNAERGFSYMKDAPLDMRMDKSAPFSAFDVINGYDEDELTKIFFKYGEERFSKRIARAILEARKQKAIQTTTELANLIQKNYPAGFKDGHPAKRVFQAVRIETNGELTGLYETVTDMAKSLKTGGRMAVITFHSLEDRIVKQAFKELESDCVCNKQMPICTCNKIQEVKIITKKPIIASEGELKQNKRAASAKLRIVERLEIRG
jgi:16S rRNA (cytosine1402-N4)-methyltransferase